MRLDGTTVFFYFGVGLLLGPLLGVIPLSAQSLSSIDEQGLRASGQEQLLAQVEDGDEGISDETAPPPATEGQQSQSPDSPDNGDDIGPNEEDGNPNGEGESGEGLPQEIETQTDGLEASDEASPQAQNLDETPENEEGLQSYLANPPVAGTRAVKNAELTKEEIKAQNDLTRDFLTREWGNDPEANDLLTQLERGSKKVGWNLFNRAQTLFFISIPFAVLINFTLKTTFTTAGQLGAVLEDGENPILPGDFRYFRDTTPANMVDPFFVYTVSANVLWPLTVALNDVIERTTSDSFTYRQRVTIRQRRFADDLMRTKF